MLLAVGFFLVWLSIFYALTEKRRRGVFAISVWALSIVSVIDYMFFGTNLGVLSNTLRFDNAPVFSHSEYFLNILVIILAVSAGCVLYRFYPKAVIVVLISASVAFAGMSVYNCVNIKKGYDETARIASMSGEDPIIKLSRSGKNVMIIMMDRMIGRFVPYIMEEDPKLYEQYDGFTYYANTVSFSSKTNAGSPGLYGGYEYIPEEMNERDTELLVDKHDEALKVMPVIFDAAGMDVTVFDPPYAGYEIIPDLSIYDDYPSINKYITMGNKSIMGGIDNRERVEKVVNRNLFCYSILKVSPLIFQRTLYNGGNYNSTRVEESESEIDMTDQSTLWLSQSHGITEHFMEAYKVLDSMPDLTRIEDGDQGCFLIMANDTTHEPVMLKEPEYVPANDVDNREYDKDHLKKYDSTGNMINLDDKNYVHEVNLDKVKHYQINMCAMKKLGEYFDFLRENGVYDNTKIIIVSDHSIDLKVDDSFVIAGLDENGKPTAKDSTAY